jgi:hypothetical protein
MLQSVPLGAHDSSWGGGVDFLRLYGYAGATLRWAESNSYMVCCRQPQPKKHTSTTALQPVVKEVANASA